MPELLIVWSHIVNRKLHRGAHAAAIAACVGALAIGVTACSTDTVTWGAEGAAVRSSATQFISDAQIANGAPAVCSGADVDLGTPPDWADLAPGEPAKYTAEQGKQYEALSPTWVINLSHYSTAAESISKDVPAILYFTGSEESLCVVAIEWGQLATTG